MVWNLHKGSEKYFQENFLELANQKDIVISQEMYLNTEMFELLNLFSQNHYTSATSFFAGKKEIRTGVMTGGNTYPKNVKFIRTENLEPILNSPKMSLITTYAIKDSLKELTIINIHSINFVKNEAFKIEIERIYDEIKNLTGPIIFTGDFNTWNEFRISYLNKIKTKLGFKEAEFSPDNRMQFNGNPLDHFFHSKDIEILSAKVEGHYEGSDHRPLELIIKFKSL